MNWTMNWTIHWTMNWTMNWTLNCTMRKVYPNLLTVYIPFPAFIKDRKRAGILEYWDIGIGIGIGIFGIYYHILLYDFIPIS